MKIEQGNYYNSMLNGGLVNPTSKKPQNAVTYEKVSEAEALKRKVADQRDALIDSQQKPEKSGHEDDISFIKEHGMQAFVEAEHARKIEELRDEILKAMGLTEEALSEMPAKDRAAIEKIVDREVGARLAAESAVNDDGQDASTRQIKNLILSSASPSFAGGQVAQVEMSVHEFLNGAPDTTNSTDLFPELTSKK